MLYRITLAVDVEADSLSEASNAAAAPVQKALAERARTMSVVANDVAHVTRCEVTQAVVL